MQRLVLGQNTRELGLPEIRPDVKGEHGHIDSWSKAKAFTQWLLGYEIRTPEVKAFHESDARVRIVEAPARGSKSYAAAFDVPGFFLPTNIPCDVLVWCIGATHAVNKEFDYLWEIFVEREDLWRAILPDFKILRRVNSPNAGDREIRFVKEVRDGTPYYVTIKGLSAENEKTIQGEQVSIAIMSEAAEQPSHIFDKYLASRTRWAVLPTTPKPKAQWLKEKADQGRENPETGIDTFVFGYHRRANGARYNANPLYDWDQFEQEEHAARIRAQQALGPHADAADDPYFAEQFLGHWVYYTGRVLPFSRGRHVIPFDAVDPTGCLVAVSIDSGYEDPCSAGIWLVHPSGIYIRYDEVYERRITTQEFVERVHAKLAALGLTADYCTGDPSAPQVDRIFHEAGLLVHPRDKNAQRSRPAGYRKTIDALMQGPMDGFPGILITDRCTNAAREYESLRYKEGFANEYSTSAIVGADHAVDDTRYFLMTRPRVREEEPDERDWQKEALWELSPAAERYYWPEGKPGFLRAA